MAPKTIIVTGASRGEHPPTNSLQPVLTTPPGIGLAIAKYLLSAPEAHNVVVVARSLEPLQKLKEQYSKQVEVVSGDLADTSLAQKAVDAAISSFGQLDGMVLNHGILGQVGKISTTEVAQWQHAFNVNFMSLVAFVSFRPSKEAPNLHLTTSRSRRACQPSASPRARLFSHHRVPQS